MNRLAAALLLSSALVTAARAEPAAPAAQAAQAAPAAQAAVATAPAAPQAPAAAGPSGPIPPGAAARARWERMTPEERQAFRGRMKAFRELPPETQAALREILQAGPREQARYLENLRRWRAMTPAERQQARERWRAMTPEERQQARERGAKQ